VKNNVLLPRALLLNSVFSAVCAAFLVLAPEMIGALLGLAWPGLYQAIGFMLALFAVVTFWQARRSRVSKPLAKLISLADFGWVLGSIILLVGWSSQFSFSGVVIIIVVAAMVGIFACLQISGLQKYQ
jgi:hypothetical protein